MKIHTLAVLLVLASICSYRTVIADEKGKLDLVPIISQKGELIFQDDFDEKEIKPDWEGLHGTQWTLIDGVLRGKPSSEKYQKKQIALNNRAHSGLSPTCRLNVAVDDCIVLFRFKMDSSLTETHFGFDDGRTGTQHVARLIVSSKTGLSIRKDKNAKLKGDKNEVLVTNEFNLEPDTWYWMMLEVVDDEIAAQVSGGAVLRATHPRFDIPKGQIKLPTRGGGTIFYDHVRIWQALPAKDGE